MVLSIYHVYGLDVLRMLPEMFIAEFANWPLKDLSSLVEVGDVTRLRNKLLDCADTINISNVSNIHFANLPNGLPPNSRI